VIENGGELARRFDDEQMMDAVREAKEQAGATIATVPQQVDALVASLNEAAAYGGEVRWLGTLVEKRRNGPWSTTTTPLTARLAQAAQHAH
jgi:hypothetical protein